MTRSAVATLICISLTIICIVTQESSTQILTPPEENKKPNSLYKNGDEATFQSEEEPTENNSRPFRIVKGARNQQGSIHEGLRYDYLLSITLPWTCGMFLFVVFFLVCMRTNGWLYHLFTDDYVPPAVKKRMEEEARRASGRKARQEHVDDWKEIRTTWETDLKECTQRVKATMPPTAPKPPQ